ncbi:uncharacterized protein DUF3987 [Pontibacter ummariensis]|uniref:DUF3987 domain-containing protein n=1 Tax=Pontibacter ummariensis TaxID=1610492 RepID=A0A239J072_9BACT|nr:DUF3987 domain-containing protein [Pontibacter ummariensis]PRY09037.1 uncharacterized protein DUF3987 [Pontibacter ummariensis]SNS98868.1 Protein of unknown function [Pontibacter ummariensis]
MSSFNPQFDLQSYGIDGDNIVAEAQQICSKFDETDRKEKNPFPVEAFPVAVQQIIRATNESLNFPVDFAGAAVLYSVSLAIGNTHRVEVMKGWLESALLYITLVGRPGTNKSHPLSWYIQPIFAKDKASYKQFEQEWKEYQRVVGLSKQERKEQGVMEDPAKPVWRKFIVSDFTLEGLTELKRHNKRGIGVFVDELATWTKNFNRYTKGSEQEFWLSNWSSKPIVVDRKTGEPTFISQPFIPVTGTIQNALLEEMAKDNRSQNGFIDRILFAMPSELKKDYWSETELPEEYNQNWDIIVSNLLDLRLTMDDTDTPVSTILQFTPEAKAALKEWQMRNTDLCNNASNEAVAGIYSKLEIYAVRLSLILQLLHWATGESDKQAVETKAVNGAILLIEYFRKTALCAHATVSNDNPLDKLPTDQQRLYDALPAAFTTATGVQIAERCGVPERTFKRLLNDKELFEKPRRGEYEKRL